MLVAGVYPQVEEIPVVVLHICFKAIHLYLGGVFITAYFGIGLVYYCVDEVGSVSVKPAGFCKEAVLFFLYAIEGACVYIGAVLRFQGRVGDLVIAVAE